MQRKGKQIDGGSINLYCNRGAGDLAALGQKHLSSLGPASQQTPGHVSSLEKCSSEFFTPLIALALASKTLDEAGGGGAPVQEVEGATEENE